MRILHYVGAFSLPSETFIYDLINNLEKNSCNNYVLTHLRELEDERPFSKVIVINENVNILKKIYYRLFGKWKIRNHIKVIEVIDHIKPDIIHAHFGPNGVKIFNIIEKYNLNIPLVVSFHGMDINVLPRKDRLYTKYLLDLNKSNHVLFTSPSNFLKNKMMKLGLCDDKISIIPNAYNNIFEAVQKENFWQYGDTLKLLNIGRFEEVKGQKYLIEAFAEVIKIYPNTILTLIGYGSLEQELKDLCKTIKIENKVHFLRQVEHSKLPNIIIEHDIYVQPSIVAIDGAEENLSVSTIEAQICGIPAIVSSIGGLKEIVIDNVTGKFSKEKDINSLAKSIIFYVDNDIIEEHSINAKVEAIKRFNKDSIIKKTKELYENF